MRREPLTHLHENPIVSVPVASVPARTQKQVGDLEELREPQ